MKMAYMAKTNHGDDFSNGKVCRGEQLPGFSEPQFPELLGKGLTGSFFDQRAQIRLVIVEQLR